MKIFKYSAMVIGAAAMITGFNSCKKDEDKKDECCTLSYTYDGETASANACEDGTITYSYGGTTETGNWHDDYGSWAEVKQSFVDYGGTCD